MDSVLGRKQRIKNSDWIETFDKIEQLITKKELDQLVDKTIQDIKAKTKGKKASYAWSGGKDSLVLGEICRRAGISSCVLVISNLEYKAFTQWVEDNKPPELSIINTGQDIKWLVTHPHMLFPQDSKYAAQWFHIVQHRGQAKYYKENNLDMLLLGRRRADGNYVGKGDNIYTNSQWVDRDMVKPNDYNPNKVSKQNLELLKQSILTNGWTLPIVVRPDFTIIDGFHRWTVAGEEPLKSMLEGKVPVVIVEHKDKAGNIYGTVTHNRARGTHLLEPMKAIVKELMGEGEIC